MKIKNLLFIINFNLYYSFNINFDIINFIFKKLISKIKLYLVISFIFSLKEYLILL